MSLFEPQQNLDKSELHWSLLSAIVAPILENMKTARLTAAREVLLLWQQARKKFGSYLPPIDNPRRD
jgi:hypothetical protein